MYSYTYIYTHTGSSLGGNAKLNPIPAPKIPTFVGIYTYVLLIHIQNFLIYLYANK